MTSKSLLRVVTATLIVAVMGGGAVVPITEVCAAQLQMSFSQDVFPIFRGWCISCHQPGGEGYEKSGLDLTTYQGLMKGTKYGPVVVPGQSFISDLMVLLDWRAAPEVRMPHGQKQLSSCDRNAIRDWIQEGAKNN
jgi:mono/diheme cytochrome c family protein